MSQNRTIAIGDVHGCADEFEELLAALQVRPGDRVIQLGDLINRGPDSHRCIALARKHGVEAILGNHELRLLNARRENRPEILKDYDAVTVEQMTEDDWAFIGGMPKFKYEGLTDTVFVHGGFLPDRPWQGQPVEVTLRIQVVDKDGNAAKRSEAPDAPAWADLWGGKPFVVYGHTPRPEVFDRPGSMGIDTGCVYGGNLTAFILEDRSFVQVRAHRAYAHSKRLPDPV